MFRKILRAFGFLAYLGAVTVLFVLAGYVSFNLFVRSGATRTPALSGLSIDDARALLADQGLQIRVEEEGRFDTEIPVEHVVQQNPGEGALVKRGSTVSVIPSLGPQRLSVPDLSGQSVQSAQVLLAAAGLGLGRTVEVFSEGATPGSVVAQQPKAGGAVAPGATVDLLVARKGSALTYVMPDLVYRDYDEVRRFFEGRGFRIGSVKFERYEGIRPGIILRQFPVAGHPLGRGDTISLVVAAARPAAGDGALLESAAAAAATDTPPTAP